MHKLNDRIAALILIWLLLPLVPLDIYVLVLGALRPRWDVFCTLFAMFYMIPALILYGLLLPLACGRFSSPLACSTWGAHVFFNTVASLFWISFAVVTESSGALYPLIVTMPVLLWTGYFFHRTFPALSKSIPSNSL